MIFIGIGICLLLIIRIGFIQFVQGSELQAMAYSQQTLNRKINPKRGAILDSSSENVLAMSASSETVSVTPKNIAKEDKEKVAMAMAEIFELDYESVLKKINKNSSIETIVKKIDKEDADKLRMWLENNNIKTGVNIDEDTKRYYPYSTLASTVIGFTGSDNQGLEGLEKQYDEILKGEQGKILKITDAVGSDLGEEGENYIEAIDGKNIISTIDLTVQSIAEKYLTKACIDNKCTDGGNVIVMNPKTGDVLALASYPNYDLNSPYTINNEELKKAWESMQANERSNALGKMWRNKAISDTYEPGSTFKLVTASASLEEGIVEVDKEGTFNCSGSITVAR